MYVKMNTEQAGMLWQLLRVFEKEMIRDTREQLKTMDIAKHEDRKEIERTLAVLDDTRKLRGILKSAADAAEEED